MTVQESQAKYRASAKYKRWRRKYNKRRRWRYKNDLAFRERERQWKKLAHARRAKNPEWRAAKNRKQKARSAWRRKHERGYKLREARAAKERALRSWLSRIGWTIEYHQKMFKRGCAICGVKKRKLMRDHDHATGKGRGLLCHKCNCSLGWFETHRTGIERHLGEA